MMRMPTAAGLVAGILTMLSNSVSATAQAPAGGTTTPIQHVVVIFDENISFDHYFGTYPYALNPEGEPGFLPAGNTPGVNGLTPALLQNNQNPAAPFRLDRSQALTCDNDNAYTDEQTAYHGGLIDKVAQTLSGTGTGCNIPNLAMGYYDGNTVTALWNYAQHFSMSDNFFATEFGVTVEGHLNLISGQTHQTNTASISAKWQTERSLRMSTQVMTIAATRPRWCKCPGRTSAIFSMQPASLGDGFMVISFPAPYPLRMCPRATPFTTAITNLSSFTSRHLIRITCRQLRQP